MTKHKSPWTCPKCKSRATKIVSISAPAATAITCQICDHKYPFPPSDPEMAAINNEINAAFERENPVAANTLKEEAGR